MKKIILFGLLLCATVLASAQRRDTIERKTLAEVSVKSKAEGLSRLGGAENGQKMGQEASLTPERAQLIASEIIDRVTNQKKKQLKNNK